MENGCASLNNRRSFCLSLMENLVCEESVERNALGNENGCHKLESPRVKLESISKKIEEIRNGYEEMIEGLNVVRASLCEENESLNTLENLSKGVISKERIILDEMKNSKVIESLDKDGIKPRREDGFVGICVKIIGGDVKSPSKRNEYLGCEDLRYEEVRDFTNESSGNIQAKQQMETDFFQRVKEIIKGNKFVHELRMESMIKASASLKESDLCRKGKLLDLGMDRKYDKSRQEVGFGGFHENPGNKEMLRAKDLRNVVRENVSSRSEELEKERNEVIDNLEMKSISKMVKEIENGYKKMIEGLNSARTCLCEESKSLDTLENLSIRVITKEGVNLDEKDKLKGIESLGTENLIEVSARLEKSVLSGKGKLFNTWYEDDLGKDRRYDRSSQGDGFEGSHKIPGNREVLKIKGFKVKNGNNFRISKQVENSQKVRDNVVSQERASNYYLKRQRLCKKFYLVLNRVEI